MSSEQSTCLTRNLLGVFQAVIVCKGLSVGIAVNIVAVNTSWWFHCISWNAWWACGCWARAFCCGCHSDCTSCDLSSLRCWLFIVFKFLVVGLCRLAWCCCFCRSWLGLCSWLCLCLCWLFCFPGTGLCCCCCCSPRSPRSFPSLSFGFLIITLPSFLCYGLRRCRRLPPTLFSLLLKDRLRCFWNRVGNLTSKSRFFWYWVFVFRSIHFGNGSIRSNTCGTSSNNRHCILRGWNITTCARGNIMRLWNLMWLISCCTCSSRWDITSHGSRMFRSTDPTWCSEGIAQVIKAYDITLFVKADLNTAI